MEPHRFLAGLSQTSSFLKGIILNCTQNRPVGWGWREAIGESILNVATGFLPSLLFSLVSFIESTEYGKKMYFVKIISLSTCLVFM